MDIASRKQALFMSVQYRKSDNFNDEILTTELRKSIKDILNGWFISVGIAGWLLATIILQCRLLA